MGTALPQPVRGGLSEVEIRPLYEAEDFGAQVQP